MGTGYLLLLVGSVLVGGGLSWVGQGEQLKKWLPLLLSFSGAFLLGIVALELIPAYFSEEIGQPGLFLLLGFFVQLLLENLSQGVEHGHVHAHKNAGLGFGLQVMIGLSVHAFLEGIPLAGGAEDAAHGHVHAVGEQLIWAIVLHKLPAAFALGLLLRASDYSSKVRLLCLLIFAFMSPLGAWVGHEILLSATWHHNIMALVIGSFLHISTTILFEADSSRHHRISLPKIGVVVLGMLLSYMATAGHAL